MQFSRLLRKPRKRNGAGFFRRGAAGGTRTRTLFGARDFKSLVSTDSTTAACLQLCILPCSPSIVKWKSARVFQQNLNEFSIDRNGFSGERRSEGGRFGASSAARKAASSLIRKIFIVYR